MTAWSKFNARRAEYRGEVYDSGAEARYAARLDRLRAGGAIAAWRRGTAWTLLESPTGREQDGITYRPDFEVWAPDGFKAVDVKGVETEVFRLKAKLWRAVYPTVPLYVVRADGTERRV